MYTQNGFYTFVSEGFDQGKMMLFVSEEEYYEWLEARDEDAE